MLFTTIFVRDPKNPTSRRHPAVAGCWISVHPTPPTAPPETPTRSASDQSMNQRRDAGRPSHGHGDRRRSRGRRSRRHAVRRRLFALGRGRQCRVAEILGLPRMAHGQAQSRSAAASEVLADAALYGLAGRWRQALGPRGVSGVKRGSPGNDRSRAGESPGSCLR
jgi:hypothetical protein